MKKFILISALSLLFCSNIKSQFCNEQYNFSQVYGCEWSWMVTKTGSDPVFPIYTLWDTMRFEIYSDTVDLRKCNKLLLPGSSSQYVRGDGSLATKKIQETYSGTTDVTGIYSVTFATPYSVAPNIQVTLKGSTDQQGYDGVTVTTTGFSVHVYERTYTMGVSNGTTDVSGIGIDVLITEK